MATDSRLPAIVSAVPQDAVAINASAASVVGPTLTDLRILPHLPT